MGLDIIGDLVDDDHGNAFIVNVFEYNVKHNKSFFFKG